jgi:hypothetical protein
MKRPYDQGVAHKIKDITICAEAGCWQPAVRRSLCENHARRKDRFLNRSGRRSNDN